MQIIIDIDESLLDGIKSDNFDFARQVVKNFQGTIASAIANGTLLPKGHGRLIDADVLMKDVKKHYFDDHKAIRCVEVPLSVAPTVLKADIGDVE